MAHLPLYGILVWSCKIEEAVSEVVVLINANEMARMARSILTKALALYLLLYSPAPLEHCVYC